MTSCMFVLAGDVKSIILSNILRMCVKQNNVILFALCLLKNYKCLLVVHKILNGHIFYFAHTVTV
jgi:hypothetical protein